MPPVSHQACAILVPFCLEAHPVKKNLGIDDDAQRRDSLHALINSLPDAHYATLRAIILVSLLTRFPSIYLNHKLTTTQHLNKIQEHYTQNRMNAGNLAICFGYVLSLLCFS